MTKQHKTSRLLLAVCPKCGKRVLHPRGDSDPEEAVYCELECDDCGDTGNKDYDITFFGKYGELEFVEGNDKWFFKNDGMNAMLRLKFGNGIV